MADSGALSEVAESGDYRETLKALRDRLALEIDRCESARDIAALSLRLMDVLAQLADLDAVPTAEGTPLDEFTKRRLRQDPSEGPSGTAGGHKRR